MVVIADYVEVAVGTDEVEHLLPRTIEVLELVDQHVVEGEALVGIRAIAQVAERNGDNLADQHRTRGEAGRPLRVLCSMPMASAHKDNRLVGADRPRRPPGRQGLNNGFCVSEMELNGTLSNREVLVETSELAAIKARLLVEAPSRVEPTAALGERAGRIKQTIIQVLETAGVPLRVVEIREACEQLLGVPVNRSTISDCLIKHSTGASRCSTGLGAVRTPGDRRKVQWRIRSIGFRSITRRPTGGNAVMKGCDQKPIRATDKIEPMFADLARR